MVFLFFQLLKFEIIFQKIRDIYQHTSILDRETGKRNLPDNGIKQSS